MIPIVSDFWLAAVGLEQLPEIHGVSPLGAQQLWIIVDQHGLSELVRCPDGGPRSICWS
jgi:hypothetical protein